ncbi:MAG: O-antigen ligase family protein [Ardenticatenaceae bacterium]|nr:O-antigen ligase family protein [Ardenticatenaceae bacterium]
MSHIMWMFSRIRFHKEVAPLRFVYGLLGVAAILAGSAVALGSPLMLAAGLAVVAAVVGLVALVCFQHQLLFVFFLVLPFYPLSVFAAERALGLDGTTSPLRAVRDLIAISLLILVFSYHLIYKRRLPFQPNMVDKLIVVLLGVGFIYIVPAPSLTIGLLGFRENYVYFLFYFVGRCTVFSEFEWKWLLRVLLISGIGTALFALYQVFFLGAAWLAQFRDVRTLFVSWGDSYTQRGVGTFSSPNELGGYLTIVIVIVLAFLVYDRLHWRLPSWPLWGAILVMLAAVVSTYSRTSWIALGIAVVALMWRRKRLLFASAAAGSLGIIMAKPEVILYLQRTISFSDISAAYHLETLGRSFPYMLDHLFGVGLGTTGVVNERFADGTGVHFEGFYFNLVVEAGLWSVIILWSVFVAQYWYLHQAIATAVSLLAVRLLAACRALVVAIAATGFFLPLMVSREVAFLFWFLMGSSLSLVRLPRGRQAPDGQS